MNHSCEDIYIIAEINTSHFGNIDLAKELIVSAKAAGADCVKFQSWSERSLYSKSFFQENPIAHRFIKKFSLSEAQLKELAEFCLSIGIDFLSTPYSTEEAKFLVSQRASVGIKVASMDIDNIPYLESIASYNRRIFLSTGMATIEEIDHAVKALCKHGADDIVLLHCVSQYPTELRAANINNVSMLKQRYPQLLVGYSDHTEGVEAAMAAIALGAEVIERHFTLDKTRIGMDNNMATEPKEFQYLVDRCRNTRVALGSYNRNLTVDDWTQRRIMRRSLVYRHSFKKGHRLKIEDVLFKRPGSGLNISDLKMVLGRELAEDVSEDTLIMLADLKA